MVFHCFLNVNRNHWPINCRAPAHHGLLFQRCEVLYKPASVTGLKGWTGSKETLIACSGTGSSTNVSNASDWEYCKRQNFWGKNASGCLKSKLLDQTAHTLLNMQIILVSNLSTSSNWLCVIVDSMILLAPEVRTNRKKKTF